MSLPGAQPFMQRPPAVGQPPMGQPPMPGGAAPPYVGGPPMGQPPGMMPGPGMVGQPPMGNPWGLQGGQMPGQMGAQQSPYPQLGALAAMLPQQGY